MTPTHAELTRQVRELRAENTRLRDELHATHLTLLAARKALKQQIRHATGLATLLAQGVVRKLRRKRPPTGGTAQ